MIVELIIKTDDRKIVSHVEWKGDEAHLGEIEMIVGHDLRRAFAKGNSSTRRQVEGEADAIIEKWQKSGK